MAGNRALYDIIMDPTFAILNILSLEFLRLGILNNSKRMIQEIVLLVWIRISYTIIGVIHITFVQNTWDWDWGCRRIPKYFQVLDDVSEPVVFVFVDEEAYKAYNS